MAARSATQAAEFDGTLNGFITGAATLLVLVWLATTAVSGALGFFATTVVDIAGAAAPATQAATERAEPSAWGTTIAILLAVGASTLGSLGDKGWG